MSETYDKCSKQMYDTVRRLMELAQADNSDGFFKLAKASKSLFSSGYSLFETAVAAGLTARNKAEILDKFILDTSENGIFFGDKKILCNLAGILIRKRRCREAVKRLISIISEDDFSHKYYILLCAAMADDIEIFRLIYNNENSLRTDLCYKQYYESCLLVCGLMKSKKVLDHITDGGNDLLKEKMPYDIDFNEFIYISYFPLLNGPKIFSDTENDILFSWLKNIYSMYFSGETPEASYKILMNIAGNTGLTADRNFALSFYSGDIALHKAIMREMNILLMFGQKKDDLTSFLHLSYKRDSEYIDVLAKIAGDEPFITFEDAAMRFDIDFIAKLAQALENRLTVRLVNGFDMYDIKKLQDIAKLEVDIENSKTFKNISLFLSQNKPLIRSDLEDWQTNRREFVKYIIDSGFASVEQMTEIAASVNNTYILNMLFNYGK